MTIMTPFGPLAPPPPSRCEHCGGEFRTGGHPRNMKRFNNHVKACKGEQLRRRAEEAAFEAHQQERCEKVKRLTDVGVSNSAAVVIVELIMEAI